MASRLGPGRYLWLGQKQFEVIRDPLFHTWLAIPAGEDEPESFPQYGAVPHFRSKADALAVLKAVYGLKRSKETT
jgi:hypothetical protein